MINYYKILGLENYASIDEVKKAYKSRIKTVHPDVNQRADAEEVTQYLNLAKEHLAEIETKEKYDKQLKLAYLLEIQRLSKGVNTTENDEKNNYWRSLSRKQRLDKLDKKRKLKIRDQYLNSIAKFPRSLRIIGLVVLAAWALQMVYAHYFIRFGSTDALLAALGYILLAVALATTANEAYTYYLVKSLEKPIHFDYEKRIAQFFILGFIVFTFSVNGLNVLRKNYHLANHFDYTTGKIDFKNSSLDQVVVTFQVGREYYRRNLEGNLFDIIRLPNGNTVVRYAKVDPKICELVVNGEK